MKNLITQPWKISAEQSPEDRISKYIQAIDAKTRKIPSLVFDDSDCAEILELCSQSEILKLLKEKNREPLIFSPVQKECNRFNGKILLVFAFQNPQERRKQEKEELQQAREAAAERYGNWLNWCWRKTA